MGLRTMLWKHPKTNVYYFRKRIPADLVKACGREIIKQSLHTKDRKEADKLVLKAEANFNTLMESQRLNQQVPYTERQQALQDLQSFGILPFSLADITLDILEGTSINPF